MSPFSALLDLHGVPVLRCPARSLGPILHSSCGWRRSRVSPRVSVHSTAGTAVPERPRRTTWTRRCASPRSATSPLLRPLRGPHRWWRLRPHSPRPCARRARKVHSQWRLQVMMTMYDSAHPAALSDLRSHAIHLLTALLLLSLLPLLSLHEVTARLALR